MKTAFYVKWHISNPYSAFKKLYFTPIKGWARHCPLCGVPLAMVQVGFVTDGGPKLGSEATERGEGVHGREIFLL